VCVTHFLEKMNNIALISARTPDVKSLFYLKCVPIFSQSINMSEIEGWCVFIAGLKLCVYEGRVFCPLNP